MRRRGSSLLELVIVLGILGLLLAMYFPAVQRMRGAANRTVCANNLRQIGLGIHQYHDSVGYLPHARECPAPWLNGQDPYCRSLPTPNTFTGPNEKWWAPYDNRPGATPTRALADYVPTSTLMPYIGDDPRLFRCPEGFDSTIGSPTQGETFQISYALNPKMGGKRLTDPGGGGFASEHMDLPCCDGQPPAGHWVPWGASASVSKERHLPSRHQRTASVLHRDGSVAMVSR